MARRHDGRELRRYRRRGKVERTFGRIQNFRRLVIRWDRDLGTYRADVHIACTLIVLRHF